MLVGVGAFGSGIATGVIIVGVIDDVGAGLDVGTRISVGTGLAVGIGLAVGADEDAGVGKGVVGALVVGVNAKDMLMLIDIENISISIKSRYRLQTKGKYKNKQCKNQWFVFVLKRKCLFP